MLRRLAGGFLALALALAAAGATIKLYMADGSYELVREYQVRGDRVRYYSVERSTWEEIPVRLVDLKRTQAEETDRAETQKRELKAISEEEQFEREQRREIERVPQEPGVYLLQQGQLIAIKQAESKIATNKRRSVLKVLSPVPIVSGKANIELDGERSANLVAAERPEFYVRLSTDERFGIVGLTAQKGVRVVQKLTIVPITKEIVEEQQDVEVFRKQLDEGLYKIWPVKALEPGEYAVIQYTQGKGNVQVWDFGYRK